MGPLPSSITHEAHTLTWLNLGSNNLGEYYSQEGIGTSHLLTHSLTQNAYTHAHMEREMKRLGKWNEYAEYMNIRLAFKDSIFRSINVQSCAHTHGQPRTQTNALVSHTHTHAEKEREKEREREGEKEREREKERYSFRC